MSKQRLCDDVSKCPVCDATGPFPVFERAGANVFRHCASCDVLFADPFKPATEEWYQETYRDNRWRLFGTWTELPLNTSHRAFFDHFSPPARLLDVGCGSGRLVYMACARGFDAIGTDFDAQAVAMGNRAFGGDRLRHGTFETLPEGLGPFDVISAFDVVEHLDDPAGFLRSVRGRLRADGQIVISTPNRSREPKQYFEGLRAGVDAPPHHLTKWSRGSLRAAIERAGFQVRIVDAIGGLATFALPTQRIGFFLRSLRARLRPRASERTTEADQHGPSVGPQAAVSPTSDGIVERLARIKRMAEEPIVRFRERRVRAAGYEGPVLFAIGKAA